MLITQNHCCKKAGRGLWQAVQAALFFGLTGILTAGCATTRINSEWKDQAYRVMPRKILVIGIEKNAQTKRAIEDEFVRQIKLTGTDAVAGYSVIAESEKDNREAATEAIKKEGADAVLITRVGDKKTIYKCLAPNNYCPPNYYGTWHDYYWFGSQFTDYPDYVDEAEYITMETNLYDAAGDKLVWSASSDTEVVDESLRYVKSYVTVMMKNLMDKSLLNKVKIE